MAGLEPVDLAQRRRGSGLRWAELPIPHPPHPLADPCADDLNALLKEWLDAVLQEPQLVRQPRPNEIWTIGSSLART